MPSLSHVLQGEVLGLWNRMWLKISRIAPGKLERDSRVKLGSFGSGALFSETPHPEILSPSTNKSERSAEMALYILPCDENPRR